MRRVLAILIATAAVAIPLGAQTFRSANPPRLGVMAFGSAVAMEGGRLYVGRSGMGAAFQMPSAETGGVHVFRRGAGGTGAWTEAAAIRPRDATAGDGFGSAIAIDANTMIIGAPGAGEGRGAVYVFQRASAGGEWAERSRLAITDGRRGDALGSAVAVSGNTVIAGAPGRGEGRGTAIVFRRDASGRWIEDAQLNPGGAAAGGRFGSSLAVAGELAVVGAPGGGMGMMGPPQLRAGSAVVFGRTASGWTETTSLAAQDSTILGLGSAVLIDGDAILVGAAMSGMAIGAVVEFRREGGTWRRAAIVRAATPEQPGMFGAALAKAGTDLIVGSPLAGHAAGAVFVLRRDGATWKEAHRFTTTGTGLGVMLGASVAADGAMMVAGGPMGDFFEGLAFPYEKDARTGAWTAGTPFHERPVAAMTAMTGREIRCDSTTGKAGAFSCRDADLLAYLPMSAIGGKRGTMTNDVWGWADPQTGREYALVGRTDALAIVDISNPLNPVHIGDLPLHAGANPNLWRDVEVYRNHAFIVSDGAGAHGMQVLDLTQLRTVRNPPVTFTETAHYDRLASAHTLAIDTVSGFAYALGAGGGGESCGGALHMIDIRDPLKPVFAGCYADPATGMARTGYTHDAQCVVYRGPDEQYRGRQICFNASETALGIADVTDKAAPKRLSAASYPNVGYTHQGWLTDDHRYFFVNDELDELAGTVPKTRTLVFDVTDLDDPVVAKEFLGTTAATDHNLFIRGRYMYQSNYVAGLRIIDIADPLNPVEVGYFDTVFGPDAPGFAGTWSNYPFFRNGVVAVPSMREGLFLIRFRKGATIVP